MAFHLTRKQEKAANVLGSDARHILLFGGARSGKTLLIMRQLVGRALAVPSRHLVVRFRFNHVKTSIIHQTLPTVMDICYPGVSDYCKLDKSDWFYEFDNGSQIWFGGLDDKERTEKILGQEYCVDPYAKVLTADLRWVPACMLRAGDELIAFPEGLDGHCKLISSHVERADIIQAERYRIFTDKGSTVVSAGHGFVAHYDDRRHRNFRQFSWRKAEELKVGDRIRWTCQPWDVGQGHEDGWMAGIIDGEGWESRPARQVGVAQRAGAVLDAIIKWFTNNGVEHTISSSGGKDTRAPCYQVKARGLWASLRLLGITRPKRLTGRKIWTDCRAFRLPGHDATVLEIQPIGVGPVVALGTSSKTFIADGFLGHNSSMFFNECSQIPFASRSMAITRLAQKTKLRIKAYYDCNPPPMGHWTHRLFVEKRDPISRAQISDPDNYFAFGPMNPVDNAENLPEETLEEFQNLPERLRKRFFYGQWADASEGALWTEELLEQCRGGETEMPEMQRVVVAVDPSGCSGPEDTRSDEIGIVVCGLGTDGKGYVLEDLSGRFGPAEWGQIVVGAFDRHMADAVVGETNFGGDMVAEVVRSAARQGNADRSVPFRKVTASRGKVVRAEPISALFEQQKVVMAGFFPDLEAQMCAMTAAGYVGDRSPDRLDALVWGLSSLFPGLTRRQDTEFRKTPKVVLAYQNSKQHRPGPRVVTRRT